MVGTVCHLVYMLFVHPKIVSFHFAAIVVPMSHFASQYPISYLIFDKEMKTMNFVRCCILSVVQYTLMFDFQFNDRTVEFTWKIVSTKRNQRRKRKKNPVYHIIDIIWINHVSMNPSIGEVEQRIVA